MPTYDFVCNTCGKRFDVFLTFSEYGVKTVLCAHCQSADVRRRMTKVRIAKTQEQRLESMAEEFENFAGLDGDPKAMGQMMKKMGQQMGEELPAEFDEVIDRLEAGQSPQEIESALPDSGETSESE
ncbi:MAG: zinc ribbon domain-containing protein [Chloroflexi bacterium]|nr:zinc ribbon domain-containing protein [Chloroflexota bacterium]